MKTNIIVILGASGSGKDHRVNTFYHGNAAHIEPIAPWRRFLEDTFSLQRGVLDTQEGKSAMVPGSPSTTFGEYMVKMYHAHREVGVSISEPMLSYQLNAWYNGFEHVDKAVVTSVRTVEEADVIVRFAKKHGVDIKTEVLYNRGELKTSDLELVNIIGHLSKHSAETLFIDNGAVLNA